MTVASSTRGLAGIAFVSVLLAGCSPNPPVIPTAAPTSAETTATYEALRNLPAPSQPVPVAVYSYPDLTGQFKASETVSTSSRAVTQGAVWMLVKSLKDAAAGGWFKVIQRANLDNLLKERQIIRETRGRVEKETGGAQPGLPSLLFAGVILEGGIIGYDSNTVTGGLGARYLGIGGDVQYRQDTVSVYLNAVSSQTGEVLKSVMTRKTVVSYGVRGSVFKFVSFQKLLEGETGYTVNEPGQIALAQAIEHAVRSLIIEGALEGLWQFEDEFAGKDVTQAYLEDKEDDLLLGDATSAVAQALLNEDQLQRIADARKARRERLEEQDLRRQEQALVEQRKRQAEEKKLAAAKVPSPEEMEKAQARNAPIASPEQLAQLDEPAEQKTVAEKSKPADVSPREKALAMAASVPSPAELELKAPARNVVVTPQKQLAEREESAKTKVASAEAGTKASHVPTSRPRQLVNLEKAKADAPKKVASAKAGSKASHVPTSRPKQIEAVVGGKHAAALLNLARQEETQAAKQAIPASTLTRERLESVVNAKRANALLGLARQEEVEAASLVQLAADLGLTKTGEAERAGEQKKSSPKVRPITRPGPALDRDDVLNDASVEHLIPKLKPAIASLRETPISAPLLLELTATTFQDGPSGGR